MQLFVLVRWSILFLASLRTFLMSVLQWHRSSNRPSTAHIVAPRNSETHLLDTDMPPLSSSVHY
jgi:hypothetical protein